MAKLVFNYGAMSAGKSIDVLTTAYKYNSKGMLALLAKPAIDTKASNKISSRVGLEKETDFLIGKDDKIVDLLKKYQNITCLIIDEAQFLTKEQVKELVFICKEMDIEVLCYGLKVDFRGDLFEGTNALLCFAEEVNEMKALCKCGNIARFNARKINGEYVYEGKQVVIGADETYEPLCLNCFYKEVLLKKSDFNQKILKLKR